MRVSNSENYKKHLSSAICFAVFALMFFAIASYGTHTFAALQFEEKYEATYQGGDDDAATGIAVDGAGDAYVGGSSVYECVVRSRISPCSVIYAMTTVGYDANGRQKWAEGYTPGGVYFPLTYGTAVAVDPDGFVYSVGHEDTFEVWPLVIKYTPSGGTAVWRSLDDTLGGEFNPCNAQAMSPQAISFDAQGRIYIAATMSGCVASGVDAHFRVFRLNPDGTHADFSNTNRSAKYYSGGSGGGGWGKDRDYVTGVAVAPDGSFYVSGYISNYNATLGYSKEDWRVVKFKADGSLDVLWSSNPATRFDSGKNDRAEGIVVGNDGNVYVAGTVGVDPLNPYTTEAVKIIKYSSLTGGILAENTRQFPNAYMGGITKNPNGEIYVGSSNTSSINGVLTSSISGVIKYDALLNPMWLSSQWGFSLNSWRTNGIAVDGSGGVYIAGLNESVGSLSPSPSFDYKAFKVLESGTITPPQPPLAVSLAANPTFGERPLTSLLTATVSGAQTSLPQQNQYNFNCGNGSSTTVLGQSIATASCRYATSTIFVASVLVTDGAGRTATAITNIEVSDPSVPSGTISVSLSANPNFGQRPLNNVDMTAAVSGTATGPFTYTFDCGNGTGGASSSALLAYTAADLCNYPVADVYKAKVTVEDLTTNDTAIGTATVNVFGINEEPPF